MTINELIELGIKKLSASTPASPRRRVEAGSPALDAEVLLSHILDKPKEYLLANPKQTVDQKKEIQYKKLLDRRRSGWPVAYLTNGKEFLSLNFLVNKSVLIPRPETEGLVELAVKKIKQNNLRKILDLGTGSGNIIISIAKNEATRQSNFRSPRDLRSLAMEYYASDNSPKALLVARKNAKHHGIKITFKRGNLLDPWKQKAFDIILANLPYGWKEWKNNSSADTKGLKFEPANALFTDKKGLGLYSKLFDQIKKLKKQPKILILEFDPRQTADLKKLARKTLPNYQTTIYKDLSGRDRYCQMIKKTRSK